MEVGPSCAVKSRLKQNLKHFNGEKSTQKKTKKQYGTEMWSSGYESTP